MKCGGWGIAIREWEFKTRRRRLEPERSVPMIMIGLHVTCGIEPVGSFHEAMQGLQETV